MGKKVICPECAAQFEATDDVMIREVLTCPDCGLDLEVTAIHDTHIDVGKIMLEREDWGE